MKGYHMSKMLMLDASCNRLQTAAFKDYYSGSKYLLLVQRDVAYNHFLLNSYVLLLQNPEHHLGSPGSYAQLLQNLELLDSYVPLLQNLELHSYSGNFLELEC